MGGDLVRQIRALVTEAKDAQRDHEELMRDAGVERDRMREVDGEFVAVAEHLQLALERAGRAEGQSARYQQDALRKKTEERQHR
jgi:hypothetical protein